MPIEKKIVQHVKKWRQKKNHKNKVDKNLWRKKAYNSTFNTDYKFFFCYSEWLDCEFQGWILWEEIDRADPYCIACFKYCCKYYPVTRLPKRHCSCREMCWCLDRNIDFHTIYALAQHRAMLAASSTSFLHKRWVLPIIRHRLPRYHLKSVYVIVRVGICYTSKPLAKSVYAYLSVSVMQSKFGIFTTISKYASFWAIWMPAMHFDDASKSPPIMIGPPKFWK